MSHAQRLRHLNSAIAGVAVLVQLIAALLLRRRKRARDRLEEPAEPAPRRVVRRIPHGRREPRYPHQQGRTKYDRPWRKGMVWTEYLDGMNRGNPGGRMSGPQRREFAIKFRMPVEAFVDLAYAIEEKYPNLREPAVAVSLKVAACIRWLALGCAWDGLEEGFSVSAKTMSNFFKDAFLPHMLSVYGEHVRAPRTKEDLEEAVDGFERAGFPGCVGARDGTHVLFSGEFEFNPKPLLFTHGQFD